LFIVGWTSLLSRSAKEKNLKIEKITLKNFRCFGPEPTEISLEAGVTALVGGNGAGKTAMLLALARLFGVSSAQRTIRLRDFHLLQENQELLNGDTLFLECVLGFPELEDGGAGGAAVPDFFEHMAASAPGAPLKARLRLQATWTDDSTPEGSIQEEIRWITTLGDDFEWDSCHRVSAIDRAAVQLVYVPAARDAASRVTELLKGRLWQAARWSDRLKGTAERGATLIQKRFEKEEPASFVIDRLKMRWQQLHEADTDTTPMLRLVDSRLEDLVRRAEFAFFPDEAGKLRDMDDLSDGQRSLFHIALTAATLETERDALALDPPNSPFEQEKLRRAHLTILAIEEPENSLSPFFLSRIMTQAREIGALSSAQVVLSSHSASILGRIEPEEVRYFRLDRVQRRSIVRPLTLPPLETEARLYVRLAVRAYPELYFARFVVLGEGESERIVMPRVSESMGIALDSSFVPVVPLGGRYVDHFWKLLSDLDIPHATLLDLDLGRRHGGASLIRGIVASLAAVGVGFEDTLEYLLDEIDPGDMTDLDDASLLDGIAGSPWLRALQEKGVFISHPIDLDYAMLMAFPGAYRHVRQGGLGPRMGAAAVAAKKAVTLKTGGNPALYAANFDEHFVWYPYLFLDRSKPEAHISALARIANADLAGNAPASLRALITRIQASIDPPVAI
jgi:putative ATP-dependent endonuclease of OLD family